jgi:SSS family solute:Na+ symporter
VAAKDALSSGRVPVLIQALAYVATYLSAVALVGFAGLAHRYGLQMLLIAAGNAWFGVWFVYRYLAWPTKLLQRKLDAKTPAELIARGSGAPGLQPFLGLLSGGLLIVYGSAVFKGAALMMQGALPWSESAWLWTLVALVAISVVWGGFRGVLYTEALQGFIMFLGVTYLVAAVLRTLGGPLAGLSALAKLPPTPEANRGFLALSEGGAGLNLIFLMLVTSVGVWAQPQMIQRHFALVSRERTRSAIPLAMLAMGITVGGAYLAGALARLILGPEVTSPDHVVPMLVRQLLPEAGRQLFALAVVSASLSTASALLHIASACLGRDVLRRPLERGEWRVAVAVSAGLSGLFAAKSGAIIAWICATSWSLVACAALVPYLTVLALKGRAPAGAAWAASLTGLSSACLWHAVAYAPTSMKLTGLAAPGILSAIHPFLIGTTSSALAFGLVWVLVSHLAPATVGETN